MRVVRRAALTKYGKAGLVALMVFLFFFLMSRIDFIVNGVLYSFGLRFSNAWYFGYWTSYVAIYVLFSVILSATYWVGSCKANRDIKVAISLFLSIIFLVIGGLQDIMFYVFWAGGLPPNNVNWLWIPEIGLVGTWNSQDQIFLTTAMICTVSAIWGVALTRKKAAKDQPEPR